MAKKIKIDGVIGWDILSKNIVEQLENETDIELEINSPGGSVFQGMAIYTALQKHKEETGGKITSHILGLAASISSVIPLVSDEIKVYDESVFMIHNPWAVAIGGAKDMKKMGDMLERLSNVIASTYNKRNGEDIATIKNAMDEETFYFGQEIIDAGYADCMAKCKPKEKKLIKDEAIGYAQIAISDAIAKFSEEQKKEDIEKAVAMLNVKKAIRPKNIIKGDSMDLNEFLEKNPEANAALESKINAAKAEGVEQERSRVLDVLSFVAMIPKNVCDAIANGIDSGDYAKAELKSQIIANAGDTSNFGKLDGKQVTDIVLEKDENVQAKEKAVTKLEAILDKKYGGSK